MKNLLSLAAIAAIAAGLSAQTTTLATATDYGVNAKAGTTSASDSDAKGTKITRGLAVSARAGRGASARSSVRPAASFTYGRGASVSESAFAASSTANGSASAGTTTAKNGKTGDAHAVVWNQAVKSGTKGKVTVFWSVRASDKGAATSAKVNVNGTDVASFDQDDRSTRKSFDVVADDKGITITITTAGMASVSGRASAGYSARTSAYFKAASAGGDAKCTFTSFGATCSKGGKLAGKATASGPTVTATMSVSGAAPRSLGALLLGRKLDRPIKIGDCTLSVVSFPVVFFTNSSGAASRTLRFRVLRDFEFSAQAAVLFRDNRATKVGTSNGLDVDCDAPPGS